MPGRAECDAKRPDPTTGAPRRGRVDPVSSRTLQFPVWQAAAVPHRAADGRQPKGKKSRQATESRPAPRAPHRPPAAHPDARARAVLRAARDAVQRVPPHQGPGGTGPPRRPGDLPDRPGRRPAEPADHPHAPAAVRAQGEDRAVVHEAGAGRAAGDHGSAAGLPAAATTQCTRTRRRACVGVWLARRLGIPHLYDMHSSLPQQLSNFRYSDSGLVAAGVRARRADDDRRVQGRDHDLPGPAGHGRGDGRWRPLGAHRERDGRGRAHRRRARRGPQCARRGASTRTRRWCSTRGPSSRTRASTC